MAPLTNAFSSAFTPQPVPSCSGRHPRPAGPAWPRRRRGAAPRAQESDDALRVPRPPESGVTAPSLWLGREEVVEAQLAALQDNNSPHIDAGIEVVYRFAGFDPWQRSTYFGVSLDLGQSARFVRIFYTPPYITLINHSHHEILSTLEVAEDTWVARVHARNDLRKGEENVYEFTLRQRLGGKYDGFWFTEKLLCDGADKKHLYGVI